MFSMVKSAFSSAWTQISDTRKAYDTFRLINEFVDLVWEHIGSRHPAYTKQFDWQGLKETIIADLRAQPWFKLNGQKLDDYHELLTSKYEERRVVLRYALVYLFEVSVIQKERAEQSFLGDVQAIQKLFLQWFETLATILDELATRQRGLAGLSSSELVESMLDKLHAANEKWQHNVVKYLPGHDELNFITKWQRALASSSDGKVQPFVEQDVYFGRYQKVIDRSAPVSYTVRGQGIYRSHRGQLVYMKSVTSPKKVADLVSESLATQIRKHIPSLVPLFAKTYLVKSVYHEVFLCSELYDDFEGLIDGRYRLTKRLSVKERIELNHRLTASQRLEFFKIVAGSLLFKDLDCNATNIGTTAAGLRKIDHQWSFCDLGADDAVNLTGEVWPFKSGSAIRPTNSFIDYRELLQSPDFIAVMREICDEFETEQLYETIHSNLQNIVYTLDETVYPVSLSTTIVREGRYDKNIVLDALTSRLGLAPLRFRDADEYIKVLSGIICQSLKCRLYSLELLAIGLGLEFAEKSGDITVYRALIERMDNDIALIRRKFRGECAMDFDKIMPKLTSAAVERARAFVKYNEPQHPVAILRRLKQRVEVLAVDDSKHEAPTIIPVDAAGRIKLKIA